jgi:hypothetical protein
MTTKAKRTPKPVGRPSGPQARRSIVLPNGDRLTPYYGEFSTTVDLSPKFLQRIRPSMPTITLGGIVYVRHDEGLKVLAEGVSSKAKRTAKKGVRR